MPKRVHSATEREDNGEASTASKRTRKATELVSPHAFPSFNRFRFF